MSSLEQTEKECAAVAIAPRVSLEDINNNIAAQYDFTAGAAIDAMQLPRLISLDLLSICILTMKNGFVIIGKSAPASPENFNDALGKKLAYDDALRQIWPLMGFALRDRLAAS